MRDGGKKANLRTKDDVDDLEALETITAEEAATLIKSHLDLIALAQRYGKLRERLMVGRNSKLTSKFLDMEVELLIAATEYGKLFDR